MVWWQEYPLLVGPYNERNSCQDVLEYIQRRGYETGGCWGLPIETKAIHLNVGDIPH